MGKFYSALKLTYSIWIKRFFELGSFIVNSKTCFSKISSASLFTMLDRQTIIDNIREQPNVVQRKLVANHEYDRFRELLKARLAECGWRDEVKRHCRQIVRDKDVEDLTVDDIIDKVTPQARSLVPATVKKELLQRIKLFLMEEAGLFPQQ